MTCNAIQQPLKQFGVGREPRTFELLCGGAETKVCSIHEQSSEIIGIAGDVWSASSSPLTETRKVKH